VDYDWADMLHGGHKSWQVGKTDRSPEERADELSKATGVPGRYNVAAKWRVINTSKAENAAHKALSDYRISGSEHFKISTEDAIRIVDGVLGQGSTGQFGTKHQEGVRPIVWRWLWTHLPDKVTATTDCS